MQYLTAMTQEKRCWGHRRFQLRPCGSKKELDRCQFYARSSEHKESYSARACQWTLLAKKILDSGTWHTHVSHVRNRHTNHHSKKNHLFLICIHGDPSLQVTDEQCPYGRWDCAIQTASKKSDFNTVLPNLAPDLATKCLNKNKGITQSGYLADLWYGDVSKACRGETVV